MTEESRQQRLQKALVAHGVSSRRKAEALIAQGAVTVNGEVARLGRRADPSRDRILLHGKPLFLADRPRLTIALHKPRGVICSHRDPHHLETVFGLLPRGFAKDHLFCAGRLDKDSEGLLILTTDGQLAQRITHPSHRLIKRYRVSLNRPFALDRIPLLVQGVKCDGELLKADRVIPLKSRKKETKHLEIHLRQGRNRQIKRMMQTLGYRVKRLSRFRIGRLDLRGLPLGHFRVLGRKEIELLLGGAKDTSLEWH